MEWKQNVSNATPNNNNNGIGDNWVDMNTHGLWLSRYNLCFNVIVRIYFWIALNSLFKPLHDHKPPKWNIHSTQNACLGWTDTRF